MTRRNLEWHLVSRSEDPVPGDGSEVLREASHYATVAEQIEKQVERLRDLADPADALKGHYADKLRESCSDLAGHLAKMQGRFETVGEQLNILYPALDTARAKTKNAVDDAVKDKAAEQIKIDDDPDYEPSYQPTWERTQPEKDCDAAVAAFDDVAEGVARKIRNAIDDGMKDGRFEGVKRGIQSMGEWVSENIVEILKTIAAIISVILVVLVIVSFFIPGLNVIMLALMLTSLAINTSLAATGNGSWTDVGLDVLGILTLGVGSAALKLAKMGRIASLSKAAKPAARVARTQAFQRVAWNGGKGVRGAIARLSPHNIAQGSRAYRSTINAARNTPLTAMKPSDLLKPSGLKDLVKSGFNSDVARHMRDLRALRAGGIPIGVTPGPLLNVAAVSSGIGTTTTAVSGTNGAITLHGLVSGR